MRILLEENGQRTGLGTFIDDLLERRKLAGITSSRLITNPDGVRLSYAMLRNRWQESRTAAMQAAIDAGDSSLAHRIKQFRFSDIQSKAASEIDDLTDASKLLGHSKEQITKTVYRRVGEVGSPTR
ncbi:integrase [Pseudomonas citronellolis]|nr:integrase [Pseudomonas citronellolis]